MAGSSPAPNRTAIVAAVVGNALEWYDFIIFGYLTVVISRLFFPADSHSASLLLTTATFGVGFFMRPVGGIFLGIYADRHGRKAVLLLIITLMTIAMALIAFAPTYKSIGPAAAVIVVVARLLQGFATGGEFSAATTFLIESAPRDRRGLYGSWQMVGQALAVLVGALLSAVLTRSLTPEALDDWGWRIPFLFGLALGPVGYFIRLRVEETTEFLRLQRASAARPSRRTALLANSRGLLACMAVVASGTISFYVILVYMPTFSRTQLHLSLHSAFLAQSVSLICLILLIPAFGALSDKIGRRPIILAALAAYLVVAYPLFAWVHRNPSTENLMVMQCVLCSLLGAFFGPMSTALAEQFPAHMRSTGLSIAYNTAVMIFGGFAQFFVTWLIETTGSPAAPSFYVMFGAGVGLLGGLFLLERGGDADLAARAPPIDLPRRAGST
jgi:MFS transporter, MHS family, proline/betaine transporter